MKGGKKDSFGEKKGRKKKTLRKKEVGREKLGETGKI